MKPEFYPVKRILRLLLTALPLLLIFAASAQQVAKSMVYQGNNIPFYQYKPVNYNPNTKYPLIIFLHGIGERGPDDGSNLSAVKTQAIPHYIDVGHPM